VIAALDQQNRIIADELRRGVDGLLAVYRFGSSVHGAARAGSDTDVALLSRHPLSVTTRFELQERLAAWLGRDVDLVDLSLASPVMAIQVVADGQLILDGDPVERGAFGDRVFSAYARLNEERRGTLERERAEGTIYGR
jgi:predicted nucleotidyltransferase